MAISSVSECGISYHAANASSQMKALRLGKPQNEDIKSRTLPLRDLHSSSFTFLHFELLTS